MQDSKQLILVLSVLAIYGYVIVGSVTVCWLYSDEIVAGRFVCDSENRVKAMLEQLMAFAGGYLAGKVGGKV